MCIELRHRWSVPLACALGAAGLLLLPGTTPVGLPGLNAAEAPSGVPMSSPPGGGGTRTGDIRVYEVGRRVRDFPAEESLSTPENAYATFNRYWASGDLLVWRRLSVPRIAERMEAPAVPKRVMSPRAVENLLDTEVVEVRIWREDFAMVFGRLPRGGTEPIDIRWLERVGDRWLNAGNDLRNGLEAARALFAATCARREQERTERQRPPVTDPEACLGPFVEHLRTRGEEPRSLMMRALREHRLVILGEIHHRPRYWAFNVAMVREKEFPARAGRIYLELPVNDQALVDRFLAADTLDSAPIVEMLRDMLWMGWPDQPMLEFFEAVWQVNRHLAPAQRIRVVLVDMARPWREIRKREDWRKYDVDRDDFMARQVVADFKAEAGARHALFIVGASHALLNMPGFDGQPRRTAGWHLRQELGTNQVFAVFPHTVEMSNNGAVRGRLVQGLFETAFARFGKRPVAFDLTQGPFAEQLFTAFPDQPTPGRFKDGYDAYLYLGPLEDEGFSPLIPGFYTDDFVQELDRRHQIMFGKGLVEGCRLDRLDGASFTAWMERDWGQARRAWSAASLGPLEAWRYGGDWEERMRVERHAEAVRDSTGVLAAARRLFEAIREADYHRDWRTRDRWQEFPAADVSYCVYTDYPGWVDRICGRFKTNPVVSVTLGSVLSDSAGRPVVPYKLTLRDGSRLEGDLPFRWQPRQGRWEGVEGLDWHGRAKP